VNANLLVDIFGGTVVGVIGEVSVDQKSFVVFAE
jgi:hypothetical protein